MRRGLRWVLILVGLAGLAVLLSPIVLPTRAPETPQFGGGRGARGGGAGGNGPPISVLAATAKVADVPIYVDAIGTVRALNTVTVNAQVDGQITEINFKEGQDVKKGDVLARIDPTLYQASYDQAVAKKAQDEAQLTNQRRDLQRYTTLLQTNAASRQQVDTQQASVDQMLAQIRVDQALIDSAAKTLSYTTITSPIDGRTGIRNVDVGNLVRSGNATGIVTLTQIQPISVLFNIPQQQLPQVIAAQTRGLVQVDALDGASSATPVDRGALQVVDNQIDQTTGTVRLKAEFPNPKLALWPGAYVNIRLLADTLKQATVVPIASVQRGPKGPFAYVVQPGDTVAMRDLTLGPQDDTQAVVRSGLAAGDRVVTAGFARLNEGARVSVAAADEPASGAAPALHQGGGAAPPGAEGGRRGGGERRRRQGADANAAAPPSAAPPNAAPGPTASSAPGSAPSSAQ
ncbi:MAG: efflux RND transporter periplasmic adaptor subunit [Methylobacteriaceae bacterium]|nr:efflux RND transporter periplasmic adaptor subunit [Methylobacteriaceae bacterium]